MSKFSEGDIISVGQQRLKVIEIVHFEGDKKPYYRLQRDEYEISEDNLVKSIEKGELQ